MSNTHRGDGPSPYPAVRHPRRTRHPNLSPTTPPAIDADGKLWPAWTRVPIERLGFVFPHVEAPGRGGR